MIEAGRDEDQFGRESGDAREDRGLPGLTEGGAACAGPGVPAVAKGRIWRAGRIRIPIRSWCATPLSQSDPALDALFLPLESRQIPWPDAGALFLRIIRLALTAPAGWWGAS